MTDFDPKSFIKDYIDTSDKNLEAGVNSLFFDSMGVKSDFDALIKAFRKECKYVYSYPEISAIIDMMIDEVDQKDLHSLQEEGEKILQNYM